MASSKNALPKTASKSRSASVFWEIRRAVGGLSEGSRRGYADAYRYGEFLDFRTDPDSTGILPASLNDNNAFFAGLPKWITTDGSNVFMYDSTGVLWQRTLTDNGIVWQVVFATPTSIGHGNGLAMYGGGVYYATDIQINQYIISTGVNTVGWQTTGLVNDQMHPMLVFQNFLCVGNGQYLETWNGTTWTGSNNPAHALVFQNGERVRCLAKWRQYLAIGTETGASTGSVPTGNIYLWDGISATYNSAIAMGGAVNAMAVQNGTLLAWVGAQADMYMYSGGQVTQKVKRFTNIANDSVEVLPGAVTNFQNRVLFGNALGTSQNVPRGVFSYGDITKDFTPMTSYDYRISNGSKLGTALGIGSICPISATEVLIGWQDSGTQGGNSPTVFGIDYLNIISGNFEQTATYQSLIFDNQRPLFKRRPIQVRITLDNPLGVGEFITVYLRKNGATGWTEIGTTNPDDNYQQTTIVFSATTETDNSTEYDGRGYQHEIRVDYGGTNLTRPIWNSIITVFTEDPDTDPTMQRT